MSQEKVDRYKKEKASRQKIIKKQKRMHRLEMTGLALLAAAFVGWIGFSVYQKIDEYQRENPEQTVMDATAIQEYLSSIQADQTAE